MGIEFAAVITLLTGSKISSPLRFAHEAAIKDSALVPRICSGREYRRLVWKAFVPCVSLPRRRGINSSNIGVPVAIRERENVSREEEKERDVYGKACDIVE